MYDVGSKVKITNGRHAGQQGIIKEIQNNKYIVDLANGRENDMELCINDMIYIMPVDNDFPEVIKLKDEINAAVANWRLRVSLINELQYYDCQRAKDVLARLVNKDPVYHVREAAYAACKTLRVKRDGKLIKLNRKNMRCIYDKGIMNKLRHVHNLLEGNYDQQGFETVFKELYPVEYDVYEGHEDNFHKWLKLRLIDISEGKTKYIRRLHVRGGKKKK